MKTRIMKKLFFLVLCLTVVIAAFPNSKVSADAAMSYITVNWANPQKLISIDKQNYQTVLTAHINGKSANLYLSFPAEGGIRFRTDIQGYFSPKSLKKISYYNLGNGVMLIQAGDTKVKLDYASQTWSMDILNSNGTLVDRITSKQMYFGYKDGVLRKVKLAGSVSGGEVLYGLGERYNSFNQVGSTVKLWNTDTGYHTASATVKKVLSYNNVPILNSSKGYTLFFNSLYGGTADIADSNSDSYSLEFNGTDFDFYVYTGTPLENLESYTTLTGKPATLPKWAFEYWAGAGSGVWGAEGATKYLDVLQKCLDGYKKLGTIPSALYGEGSPSQSDDAYPLVNKLGVRMLGWNNPGVDFWLHGFGLQNLQKWLPNIAKSKLPNVYSFNDRTTFSPVGYIDYSNPTAVNLIQAIYQKPIANGLKGLMLDYGEYIDEGLTFYNGMNGDQMHNFYAYVYAKAFHDAFSQKLGNNYVLFSRAGCAGSQSWAAAFGGDQPSTYDGLRQALVAGMNISASGFSSWGSDLGGLYGDLSPQLYLRWLQYSTFSPLMRTHGMSDHNPWTFGTLAEKTFVQYYWLRENLLDLIYSANIEAGKTGAPMMQSMAVAFPEDKDLANVNDQYLFSNELLVCPVISENDYYRTVKFPSGKWVDLWTGEVITGETTKVVEAPVNRIPVYIRSGTAIPVKVSSNFDFAESLSGKSYDALLVTPASGKRSVTSWVDSNTSYSITTNMIGTDSFSVHSNKSCSKKVVIASGSTASSVTVNGKMLNKLDALPKTASVTGYYVDYQHRRTVIFTGGNWSDLKITDSGYVSANLALNATITANSTMTQSQAESIVDGDPTTTWSISDENGTYAVVDLGKVQNINELVVKWTAYAPKSYTLEISSDSGDKPTNWKSISKNAIGGEEAYSVPSGKARYIRISKVTQDGVAPATLYELEAYGNQLTKAESQESDVSNGTGSEETTIGDQSDVTSSSVNSNTTSSNTSSSSISTKPNSNESSTVTTSGRNLIVMIGIPVVILLLVGGGVAAALIARRKKRSEPKKSE